MVPAKYQSLALAIQTAYFDVPYHNQVHAADVTQNICYMIESCDCKFLLNMTPFEVLTTVLSAAAHDLGHPGTNNAFEVKTKTDLAFFYNDTSVLENMHAAYFFSIIKQRQDCSIFDEFSEED